MSESSDNNSLAEEEQPPVPKGNRRSRIVAMIASAVVLIGAGVSAAIVTSASSGGSASPAGAVSQLLTAADNSDLLGALDAIAPGERSVIEPGLLGLVHQLQRLTILSPAAKPDDVAGLSVHFQGIETSTDYLSGTVAEVRITHGSVTTSADVAKLPIGSFVRSLVGPTKMATKSTQTNPAATGKEGIATVEVGGGWYVSLGYTVAIDSLASAHKSTALPPITLAVQPTGSSSPEAAVTAFLDNLASLNLHGMIADLAPGETAALQSYAPIFLSKAETAIARVKNSLSVSFTGYSTQTQTIGSMTLVKISHLDLSLMYNGIMVSIKGGCVTESYLGKSKTTCNSKSSTDQRIIGLLPSSLRPLFTRLTSAQPDIGVMTVEDGNSWYISPTATFLQAVDATASLFDSQDLSSIAAIAENPAAAKRQFLKLEQSLLPLITSLSA